MKDAEGATIDHIFCRKTSLSQFLKSFKIINDRGSRKLSTTIGWRTTEVNDTSSRCIGGEQTIEGTVFFKSFGF